MANANAEGGPKGERHEWRESIHSDFGFGEQMDSGSRQARPE
jgi:hypothetical protein